MVFGVLHFAFLGLLGVGLVSLRFRKLRLPYVVLVIAALAMLPVQASLVSHGALGCDGP
jgi:hypothetical protein